MTQEQVGISYDAGTGGEFLYDAGTGGDIL